MKLKMASAAVSYLCLRRMKNVLRNDLLRYMGPRPLQGWAILLVGIGAITWALCPLPALAQEITQVVSPKITSVSEISTQQYQTITIKGSGFGAQAPYTGDSPYISLEDQTASPAWQAGYSGYDDTVTLIVNSWTNSKIVLGGFSGQWGEYDYTLAVGDSVQVEVWNAQTGAGPATTYVTVGTETTTTALTSSPNPSNLDESVTFTATVTSSAGPPPDGETVSFMQGTKLLGTGTLSSGSATFKTSTLTKGNHSITADYSGDADFAASKSKAVKQVVN